jgi:NAD(P)-dependent dehydrogenase (short-subunit alcohol dehydrogenase family)
MNAELASKIVLVTGASGGIGSATAREFATGARSWSCIIKSF